jgi:hypothetical protein
MKPDLTTLYSELGLQPNCSLEEFQLVCRRRIWELQPNRLGAAASPESSAELRDMIGLYTTATRFHRRYGRLPGAAPRLSQVAGTALRGGRARVRVEHVPPQTESRSPPSSAALILAVALLVLLFMLVALASGEWFR